MEILSRPRNKANSEIKIYKPSGFNSDFGPIAFDLRKKYVLYCLTHRVVAGRPTRPTAYRDSGRPEIWCHYCSIIVKAHNHAKEALAIKRAERLAERLRMRAERLRPYHPTLGVQWHVLQANWEKRIADHQRRKETRAKAVEIIQEQVSSGEKLPRWKTGRAVKNIKAKWQAIRQEKASFGEPIILYSVSKTARYPSPELRDLAQFFNYT